MQSWKSTRTGASASTAGRTATASGEPGEGATLGFDQRLDAVRRVVRRAVDGAGNRHRLPAVRGRRLEERGKAGGVLDRGVEPEREVVAADDDRHAVVERADQLVGVG